MPFCGFFRKRRTAATALPTVTRPPSSIDGDYFDAACSVISRKTREQKSIVERGWLDLKKQLISEICNGNKRDNALVAKLSEAVDGKNAKRVCKLLTENTADFDVESLVVKARQLQSDDDKFTAWSQVEVQLKSIEAAVLDFEVIIVWLFLNFS